MAVEILNSGVVTSVLAGLAERAFSGQIKPDVFFYNAQELSSLTAIGGSAQELTGDPSIRAVRVEDRRLFTTHPRERLVVITGNNRRLEETTYVFKPEGVFTERSKFIFGRLQTEFTPVPPDTEARLLRIVSKVGEIRRG